VPRAWRAATVQQALKVQPVSLVATVQRVLKVQPVWQASKEPQVLARLAAKALRALVLPEPKVRPVSQVHKV
jgi:hypothetical protein